MLISRYPPNTTAPQRNKAFLKDYKSRWSLIRPYFLAMHWREVPFHEYTLEVKDSPNNRPQFWMLWSPYKKNSLWWKPTFFCWSFDIYKVCISTDRCPYRSLISQPLCWAPERVKLCRRPSVVVKSLWWKSCCDLLDPILGCLWKLVTI